MRKSTHAGEIGTRTCIYCNKLKPDSDFSLEHIVPRFLGGAQMPAYLKTRDVCAKCNNDLGLFVDAAFEREFLVFNSLTEIAHDFFDPLAPSSLPLRCMGASDLSPPGIRDDEVCELWLGPLGEQIYWVRPKYERFYWYCGGDPRAVKKDKTTAYFIASERSSKDPSLTWTTFRDAFSGRSVRKIMYTAWEGGDPASIGFVEPVGQEKEAMDYLRRMCAGSQGRRIQFSTNLDYDKRFMAKLALGFSHVLIGSVNSPSSYAEELRKGLWYSEGERQPGIYGQGSLAGQGSFLQETLGVRSGVTVSLLPMPQGIILNLNIGQKLNWVVLCVKREDLPTEQLKLSDDGSCFVIYKPLSQVVQITLPDLVAHNSGNLPNPELEAIELKRGVHSGYFKNL